MVSMTTASISEAKAKLSALLDRVKAGETVTITDRGVPVAQIVPLNGASEVDWDARLERDRADLVSRKGAALNLHRSRVCIVEQLHQSRVHE